MTAISITAHKILNNLHHGLLAPIYLYQAKALKRDTPRLPEAMPHDKAGRRGVIQLSQFSQASKFSQSSDILKNASNNEYQPYRLMLVGDSSACGVGVSSQHQALIGQLLLNMVNDKRITKNHCSIDWQLHATSGHDSFDVLRRLYVLPIPQFLQYQYPHEYGHVLDCVVVVVGVNDVSKMQSPTVWENHLHDIIKVIRHKFNAKRIVFTAIPPMYLFPAMPYPLSNLVGAKARQLDRYLQKVCSEYAEVAYTPFKLDFDTIAREEVGQYFAEDGFHPSALTYRLWAKDLAEYVL